MASLQSYITAHHAYWYYKFLIYSELAEIGNILCGYQLCLVVKPFVS